MLIVLTSSTVTLPELTPFTSSENWPMTVGRGTCTVDRNTTSPKFTYSFSKVKCQQLYFRTIACNRGCMLKQSSPFHFHRLRTSLGCIFSLFYVARGVPVGFSSAFSIWRIIFTFDNIFPLKIKGAEIIQGFSRCRHAKAKVIRFIAAIFAPEKMHVMLL